jgi:hypothetical protein
MKPRVKERTYKKRAWSIGSRFVPLCRKSINRRGELFHSRDCISPSRPTRLGPHLGGQEGWEPTGSLHFDPIGWARKNLWRQFLPSPLGFGFVTNPLLGQEGFMEAIPSYPTKFCFCHKPIGAGRIYGGDSFLAH